jgi:hypothetical protein
MEEFTGWRTASISTLSDVAVTALVDTYKQKNHIVFLALSFALQFSWY